MTADSQRVDQIGVVSPDRRQCPPIRQVSAEGLKVAIQVELPTEREEQPAINEDFLRELAKIVELRKEVLVIRYVGQDEMSVVVCRSTGFMQVWWIEIEQSRRSILLPNHIQGVFVENDDTTQAG